MNKYIKIEIKGLPNIYPTPNFKENFNIDTDENRIFWDLESKMTTVLRKDLAESVHFRGVNVIYPIQVVTDRKGTINGYTKESTNISNLQNARYCVIYDENNRPFNAVITDIKADNTEKTSIKRLTISFYKISLDSKNTINYLTYPECKAEKTDSDLVKISFTNNKDINSEFTKDENNLIATFYTELLPQVVRSKKMFKENSDTGRRFVNQSIDFDELHVWIYCNREQFRTFMAVCDRCFWFNNVGSKYTGCTVEWLDANNQSVKVDCVEPVTYNFSDRKELKEVFEVELIVRYNQIVYNTSA